MQAIDPHVPEACSFLRLYGFTGNTVSVFVGSDRVSAANFAYVVPKDGIVSYQPLGTIQGIPLGIWVWSSAAGSLGVEMIA
jgi:hypothetical protein